MAIHRSKVLPSSNRLAPPSNLWLACLTGPGSAGFHMNVRADESSATVPLERPGTVSGTPLLEVRSLTLEFVKDGRALRAVDGVSFTMAAGETLCLVGESGSGKSVTALSIARLVPTPPARYVAGEILLNGRDVLRMKKTELRRIRGAVVSYVFQEPGASLNPVFRVGHQIMESLKLHRPDAATPDEVMRLLKLVGIPAPESRIRDYPHQLSGGMQQRVMIAMALASRPRCSSRTSRRRRST